LGYIYYCESIHYDRAARNGAHRKVSGNTSSIVRFCVSVALCALPASAAFSQAPPPLVPPLESGQIEADAWDWVKDAGSIRLIETNYLQQYPNGVYADEARARIAALKGQGNCARPRTAPPHDKLTCEVRLAVDAAHRVERQAHDAVAAAQKAQSNAEDAAKKSDAGADGYKQESVFASDTNRSVIGQYKGEVAPHSDTPQGYGVAKWSSGGNYEGEWKKGEPNGLGVDLFAPFAITRAGTWRDRNLILGINKSDDPGATLARAGQFDTNSLNLMNGYGVERGSDGTLRIGNWHLGVLNGYAAEYDPKGKLIEQGPYYHGTLQKS
jgi:hypothetical protein